MSAVISRNNNHNRLPQDHNPTVVHTIPHQTIKGASTESRHSYSSVTKESYLQKYHPGLGHTYMLKYLVLGTLPTQDMELRVYKSKWQFRMFQEQVSFECPTTISIPLLAMKECQRVHVQLPKSKSLQRAVSGSLTLGEEDEDSKYF